MAECNKKWQDVQGTTKKKEAARRANAHATGGGPPLVCNLRPLRVGSKYSMFNYFKCMTNRYGFKKKLTNCLLIIRKYIHTVSANIKFISTMFRNW